MYKNGKLNGLSIYFHPSSWKHKTREGNYLDGKKVGEWLYFDWIPKPELDEKFEMKIYKREVYKDNLLISNNVYSN